MRNIFFLMLICCCSCSCLKTKPPLPEPDRAYLEEVRSDCKSWIKAWVREPQKVAQIAEAPSYQTFTEFQQFLNDIGIIGSLSFLRYKRIAERMSVPPLTEAQVIQQLILTAKELK